MAKFLGNKVSPTIPHFFKIIEEETLHNNKLEIPKRIVRKYGDTLGDQVLFKLPFGSEWKIGLSKSNDGKLWVDKGWFEFSKHYSLGNGYLLVLRYEGNSQFNVLICDASTIEIDYPTQQAKEEPSNDDDENLDTFSLCSRPQKRLRISPVIGQTSSSTKNHQSRSCRSKGKSDMVVDGSVVGRRKSSTLSQLSMKEKAKALKRVSGFKSEHPFFVLPMQPSYVQTKFVLNVPLDFAQVHVGTSKNIILKARDGKTWPVKFQFRIYYGKSRATIESGWKIFALDNDLKRGDVCVFSLTKSTEPVLFEVSIFRTKENSNLGFSQVHKALEFKGTPRRSLSCKLENPKGKDRAWETGNGSQSENPSFKVVMCASYANPKGHFRIPAEFGRTYINKNQNEISLSVSDGRSWSTQCKLKLNKSNGSSAFELHNGWDAFVKDYGLEEGDVCTFELTNRDHISFKVHIDKVAHEAHQNQPSGKSKIRETGVGVSRIDKFFSKNPNFWGRLQSTHLSKRNKVQNLPLSFQKSLEKKIQPVILGGDKG